MTLQRAGARRVRPMMRRYGVGEQHQGAADEAEDVEEAQAAADDGPGQGGVVGEDVEGRRGDQRADGDEAAQPERQGDPVQPAEEEQRRFSWAGRRGLA